MSGTIRKREWTESELRAEGFQHYPRKKEVVMARRLSDQEAPLRISTYSGDELVAYAGYIICYLPGSRRMAQISDYDHWPVEPQIFSKTYAAWDEPDWQPGPAQQHLMEHGCQPFYKTAGIWAKKLEEDVYIQGIEHEAPVLIPQDQILAIGKEGEPYHMGDQTFHDRYDVGEQPRPRRSILNQLVRFFRGPAKEE